MEKDPDKNIKIVCQSYMSVFLWGRFLFLGAVTHVTVGPAFCSFFFFFRKSIDPGFGLDRKQTRQQARTMCRRKRYAPVKP